MIRKTFLVALAAACIAASGLFAATASADTGLKILLLQADGGPMFSTSLQSLIAAQPGVAQVDTFDLHSNTPTVDQMRAYDEVIVTDSDFPQDATALGDNMADYEDAGGVIVATTFVWQSTNDQIGGRWQDDEYSPYVAGTGADDWGLASLGTFDATSPLMQGVTALGAYYRDDLALTSGATQVAEWSDSAGAVAYKGNAVAITGYFGDGDNGVSGQRSGDFAKVMVNAGKWLGPQTLAVARAGTGVGTVTTDTGGISCGATCSARYTRGSHVTLAATPAAGSSFSGWSGDCSGSASTCVVNLDTARNVTASFSQVPQPQPQPTSGAAIFSLVGHSVTINLKTGTGKVKLRCANVSGDQCAVNLAVQAFLGTHASKKRLTKVGTVKGTVPGGKSATLTLRLSRRGRSLLAASRHHRLKVTLTGVSKNRQGDTSKVKRTLTLKGKRVHRRR